MAALGRGRNRSRLVWIDGKGKGEERDLGGGIHLTFEPFQRALRTGGDSRGPWFGFDCAKDRNREQRG
jgi:hypothetical protein